MSIEDREATSVAQVEGDCGRYGHWLDDYVEGGLDGDLELAQVIELETHLETCGPCRRDVEALRQLLARVEDLPARRQPSRDLWTEIAPRLAARTAVDAATAAAPAVAAPAIAFRPHRAATWRRPRFWAAQGLAAALFLLLGFSAARWWAPTTPRVGLGAGGPSAVVDADGGAGDVVVVRDDSAPPQPVVNMAFITAEAEFLRAKEALLMSVIERRDEVPPSTLEVIHHHLKVIDDATRELRQALIQDPANPRLEGWVLDNYRRELSLLKRLTSQDA